MWSDWSRRPPSWRCWARLIRGPMPPLPHGSTCSTRVADLEHDDQHSSSVAADGDVAAARRCTQAGARIRDGSCRPARRPGSAGPGGRSAARARREDSARVRAAAACWSAGPAAAQHGGRRRAGNADTTAGSLRDASARSITAMRVGSASPSMGVVITPRRRRCHRSDTGSSPEPCRSACGRRRGRRPCSGRCTSPSEPPLPSTPKSTLSVCPDLPRTRGPAVRHGKHFPGKLLSRAARVNGLRAAGGASKLPDDVQLRRMRCGQEHPLLQVPVP